MQVGGDRDAGFRGQDQRADELALEAGDQFGELLLFHPGLAGGSLRGIDIQTGGEDLWLVRDKADDLVVGVRERGDDVFVASLHDSAVSARVVTCVPVISPTPAPRTHTA